MVKTRIHKYLQVTLLWGVNKDMDLFETVRDQLGCEYISDMRSCRALLNDAKKVVASLDLEAYTAWNLQIWRNICTERKCMVQRRILLFPF